MSLAPQLGMNKGFKEIIHILYDSFHCTFLERQFRVISCAGGGWKINSFPGNIERRVEELSLPER